MITGCIQNKMVKVRRGRLTGLVAKVIFHTVGIDAVAVEYKSGLALFRRCSVELIAEVL